MWTIIPGKMLAKEMKVEISNRSMIKENNDNGQKHNRKITEKC